MGTAIETEDELDKLMNHTGEAVKILFDTGHMTFAGGNSLRVINKYAKRINHFHAKDIRSKVVNDLDRSKKSFLPKFIDNNVYLRKLIEL